MNYTMAQAKRDFQRGLLQSFEVQRIPMAGGWLVVFREGQLLDGSGYLVDARSHEPREFKTLDAALRAVHAVGFRVSFLTSVS